VTSGFPGKQINSAFIEHVNVRVPEISVCLPTIYKDHFFHRFSFVRYDQFSLKRTYYLFSHYKYYCLKRKINFKYIYFV